MFKKAIITLTLLFVLLLSISSVVAVENVTVNQTSDVNHADVLETAVDIDSESDSNLCNYEDNSVLTYSPGGYNGLSDQINKYSGDTFYLSYDYRYTFTTDNTPEIEISRSITIDGCGHSINGNAVAGGFHITKGSVTLKNIKFMNCRPSTKYSSLGTAIIIDGDAADVTIENCSFYRNVADEYGGAIYCNSNGRLSIKNSYFEDNNASSGGVIFFNSPEKYDKYYGKEFLNINNCSFKSNNGLNDGVIYFNLGSNKKIVFESCNFNKNNRNGIYGKSDEGDISKTVFIDSDIHWETTKGVISKCTFNNSYVENNSVCNPILKGNTRVVRVTVLSISENYFNKMKIYVKDRYGCILKNRDIYISFDGSDEYEVYNTQDLGYIIPNMNFSLNTSHTVKVSFKGDNYNKAKNGTFNFYINPSIIVNETKEYNTNGKTCIVNYILEDGNVSSSSVVIPYGNSNRTFVNPYTNENLYKEFSILKRIEADKDITILYNDTITYSVRALDNNDKYCANQNIIFTIDGHQYNIKTNSLGYATLRIHLKAGKYPIRITNGKYSVLNSITIDPILIDNNYKNLYLNSVTTYRTQEKIIYYGWQGNLKGFLKIYNGETLVKTINLDTSGYVSDYFNYDNHSYEISTSTLDAGNYVFKIEDVNGVVIAQSNVNIKKIPTEVYSPNTEVIKSFKETIFVHLTEKLNHYEISGKVKVTINGKTYNLNIKDDWGELTFKTPSKLKKYTCTVVYDGDSNYASSSYKFILTVVKADCDVFVSDMNKVKPKSKITVKAKIYSHYGTKKVKSGTVKFKINGKTYKAKVKNGIAKVKIKAPSKGKTYTCKATYVGNKNIKASSTKFKITVKSKNKKSTSKKTTKFTVVVPVELNKKITKSHGKYKIQSYKWIDYDSNGRHAHIRLSISKNNKPLTKYKAEYYLHYSSGGGTWAYTNKNGQAGYKSREIGFNNVLKVYKVTATIWP